MIDDSNLTKFHGYVPGRWLREHDIGFGCCLGADWENATFYTDASASPESGDYVVIYLRSNVTGEVESRVKILEVDSTGQWWGLCLEGAMPIGKLPGGEHLFWPAHVEKIVARRQAATDGARIESRPVDTVANLDQHYGMQDDLSRKARVEWTQQGKRRGIPYPGTKVVCRLSDEVMNDPLVKMMSELPPGYLEQHSALRRVGASVVPATNPTTPQEAVLSVGNSVNGTIRFLIGDPVVRPIGTRFQIIRSTVSTNPAVGTVIYDGLTQVVDLPSVPIVAYYFSRAYAGSYYGPYSPNTLGLSAGAYVSAVSQVNCVTAQVFSGAGALHSSEIARVDFAPSSASALVSVTAGYRTELGNINGFQNIQIRFVTGVTSIYDAEVKIPVGGTVGARQPVTQTAVFSYTANNSAYVALQWDVASGANSFTIDQVSMRTEFIRL